MHPGLEHIVSYSSFTLSSLPPLTMENPPIRFALAEIEWARKTHGEISGFDQGAFKCAPEKDVCDVWDNHFAANNHSLAAATSFNFIMRGLSFRGTWHVCIVQN